MIGSTVEQQRKAVGDELIRALRGSERRYLPELRRLPRDVKSVVTQIKKGRRGKGLSASSLLQADVVLGRVLGQPPGWLLRAAMAAPVPEVHDVEPEDAKTITLPVLIGRWLSDVMREREVSSLQLAAAVGVNPECIYYCLSGEKRTRLSIFLRIVYALDVTEDEVSKLMDSLNSLEV